MENKPDNRKFHSLTVENRNKTILSGVSKVVSSSDTMILLDTSSGRLNIAGQNFKINRFDISSGEMSVEGTVNKITYAAAKIPFFKRIFK